jgi:hypothetical protein
VSATITKRACSIDGCEKPVHGNGFCSTHNWRMRKYGNALPVGERTIRSRFEKFYTPAPECGCWLWTGVSDKDGYGRIYYKGRLRRATRISLMLAGISVPEGMWILHKCDIPSCVNPNHLFPGTPKMNTADMLKKNRRLSPRGEQHWAARLSEDDVRVIRSSSDSQNALAEKYGVSQTAIGHIKRRISWRHL